MNNYCNVCGKRLDKSNANTCLGCGEDVCLEDYDTITGYCISCADNIPYCGC